jgi:hypothetical protein
MTTECPRGPVERIVGRLLPTTPTPEMEAAGTQALSEAGVDDVYVSVDGMIGDAARCYQAMAEAAPMIAAQWDDGEPANLLAAGADAYEWLKYLQARSKLLKMTTADWDKLDRCMAALRSFVEPPNDALSGRGPTE